MSRLRQIVFQARGRGADAKLVAQLLASIPQLDDGPSRSAYRAIVAEVVARLRSQLTSDFDLYCRCMGAFPTLVKSSLLALTQDRRRPDAHLTETSAANFEPAPWEDDDLDLVEFEWYFDPPSVEKILACFPPGASAVVSLSVPTIAAPAALQGHQVTLLDRSQGLMHRALGLCHNRAQEQVELVRWDLGKNPYRVGDQADVVVMDPPWYIEHYRAWLHTAAAACKLGGLIALPLPQLLTNRRSLSERNELLEILSGIGPVKIEEDALSYVTPSFERAVLAIEDLAGLGRWRRADLALVEVRNRHLPYEFEQVAELDWRFRRVEGRVVRTWGEKPGGDQLPVIEEADAVHGYRLTSISRNYLTSSEINLVTSRGKAAVVSNWGRLPEILDSLQDEIPLKKAIAYALADSSSSERAALAEMINGLLER